MVSAAGRAAGLSALRRGAFDVVRLDKSMAATDPEGAGLLYDTADDACLLEVNFAIHGAARLVRQTRAALARHTQDRSQARAVNLRELRDELGGALSGLLLETQLALRHTEPEHAGRLRRIVELAGDLREHLRPEAA